MSRQLACALLVFVNACAWALVTPSFHVPDEPQHFAYAQYLAESGKLPRPIEGAVFAQEQGAAFDGVRFNAVVGNRDGHPPWTRAEDERLESVLAGDLDRKSDGAFSNTTNNPPLYYLVQVVPYQVASGADFWTRLLAMRLVSALMIGLTALLVFGFLRELLPGRPAAWTAGALAAGLTPIVGFLGGGVNNDAGLALAGFAPGLLLAGGVLLARQWRDRRREAIAGLVAAGAAIAVPFALYLVAIETFWERPLWAGGVALSSSGAENAPYSLREMLSYIWLFYLPRVPGQIYDPGGYGLWDTWFTGWIGRFGWLDYDFPAWVYTVAGLVWIGMLALLFRALWTRREALRRRKGELGTYVLVVLGTLVVIGVQGYRHRIDTGGLVFEQARYLLPLLALYAAVVALAIVGAGRRAAGAVAAAFVALTLVHGLGAFVITLGRYYA